MSIKEGDTIKIHYTGKFEDGTVFDTSEKGKEPLEFKVGEGKLIKGFEKAVLGMKKDEEKEFTLKPAEAYGEPNPQLVQKVPRDQIPQDQEPKKGMMMMVGLPNGQQIPATLTEVTEKEVTVDLNHPLAGKTLIFQIKIVEC